MLAQTAPEDIDDDVEVFEPFAAPFLPLHEGGGVSMGLLAPLPLPPPVAASFDAHRFSSASISRSFSWISLHTSSMSTVHSTATPRARFAR